MKAIAIAGLPSVDLSRPVHWLNQFKGVAVTHEARVFALLYDIVERSARNPWLLHADMAPIVQDMLRRDMAEAFGRFYGRLGQAAAPSVWGDAHAHYLDPLDKPNFVPFFFQCFPTGGLLVVLDDPLNCMEKLVLHAWVPTAWEAADVTARHIAAAERAAMDFPAAVFTFRTESSGDNTGEAQRLQTWIGASGQDALAQLLRMLPAACVARSTTMDAAAQTSFQERLAHWRVALSR